MTQSNIISATNANRLYWLGRYEERVYTTMHLLRRVYDKMIDGSECEYIDFWKKFHVENTYSSQEEFELGMLYDENNPSSVISAQLRAMDNAMVLRSCIMSESLSYLEMSLAKLRECKAARCKNITSLQQLTDWSLAFFGCVEQRVENNVVLCLIYLGRIVEYTDTLIRFDYPVERIRHAFEGLSLYTHLVEHIIDNERREECEKMLAPEACLCVNAERWDMAKAKLLSLINGIVRI